LYNHRQIAEIATENNRLLIRGERRNKTGQPTCTRELRMVHSSGFST
jgi:hypothetical protein